MFRFMDTEEIEINQIEKLKMIHIYDLTGGEKGHVNALAIYYDDNKQKNLCEMDKNYDLLVQRVLYLYNSCQDKETIMVDPETKRFLEQVCRVDAQSSPISRAGSKYIGDEGVDIPKINREENLRVATMPMIIYYMTELYNMLDINIEFKHESLGWHGNTILTANVGKGQVNFPVKYIYESSDRCRVHIGNFLKNMCGLTIGISYKKQDLEIHFYSEDAGIVGDSNYHFGYHSSSCKTSIKVNDVLVYYKEDFLEEGRFAFKEKVDVSALLDMNITTAKVYTMPWKGYHICDMHTIEDGDIARIDIDTAYVDIHRDTVFIRQYAWSNVSNSKTKLSLSTGGAMLEKVVPDISLGEMQIGFLPVGYYSGWDYKKKLENKYFYKNIKEQ
ncbi:MAG: hypothetical protein E7258_08415 [Lachnospiraceae bacterium]|nr:hypothetical protein [Lachnospiraceae bacterium]